MSAAIDFSEIDELLADLRRAPDADPPGAGVNADVDPAMVRTPGVWIKHTGFTLDALGGYAHKVQLHLVVADNGYVRSRDALVALFNKVATVVEPDDDPFFQGLELPDLTVVPGLVVPVNIADSY